MILTQMIRVGGGHLIEIMVEPLTGERGFWLGDRGFEQAEITNACPP